MFQDNKTVWKKTKSITIGNNRHDFEYLDLLLKSQDISAEQVSIAVDHTGGHYPSLLVIFSNQRDMKFTTLDLPV